VNPPDAEWLNATRPEFGSGFDNYKRGSVFIRPLIDVIDDFQTDRWDGFVCTPMDIDSEDYQDPERWWL